MEKGQTKKSASRSEAEKTSEKEAVKKIERRSKAIGKEQLPTRPGIEEQMETQPLFDDDFPGAGRLKGKVALITGGDSGIGRAVAIGYAKEGALVAINYLDETEDAKTIVSEIKALGGDVVAVKGDIGDPRFCKKLVDTVVKKLGKINILVNNAAEQHSQDTLLDVTPEQLEQTFKTNIFGMMYLTKAALPHMPEGSCIINTASVTAYEGNSTLIDYASTKGAVVSFTRSMAQNLAEKKIRVNLIAPGPIWTPLIPSTFDADRVKNFGKDTLMKRPGQPIELVEAYIFLAWERASSFITGQAIHINGGCFVTN